MMIYLDNLEFTEKCERLSLETGMKVTRDPLELEKTNIFLHYDERGLSLSNGKLTMQGDFSQMALRLKSNNLQGEMLVKAVKMKGFDNLRVFDATAGMGEDSILLAASGFQVTMFEYNPIICALLQDALERGKRTEFLQEIMDRMLLVKGNSIEKMKDYPSPHVIVLDPMFPERQKSSLIKKKFQLLHYLESPCCNENELLEAAIACNPRKIVIKRPLKGPFLAGRKPDYSLSGKAIRYDCLLLH